jgi:transketolase
MKQHTIYIYTHDSIGLGEDGPTHQPVEQLSALRAVPGITVMRPADANETAMAWKYAVNSTDGPIALVLTRQKVDFYDRTTYGSADGVERGAYVLAEPPAGATPKVLLLSSGSEVGLVMKAHQQLAEQGIPTRVVSMPSMELFARQTVVYQRSVLPMGIPRVAIEAAHPMSWYKWVGLDGEVIGIERYGASAPYEKIYEGLGLTAERVMEAVKRLPS